MQLRDNNIFQTEDGIKRTKGDQKGADVEVPAQAAECGVVSQSMEKAERGLCQVLDDPWHYLNTSNEYCSSGRELHLDGECILIERGLGRD